MRTLVCMLACALFLTAQANDFREDFSKGLPSSAPSSDTKVTLASGEWMINGVCANTQNGNAVARMNVAGATLTTPPISKASSLSFSHKASGNYKDLYVEKSLDKGKTWQLLQSYKSGSGAFVQASAALAADDQQDVLFRFRCAASTVYIDNVCITYSTMASEPQRQAIVQVARHADSTWMISGSDVYLQMQKGDGDGRLLVCQKDTTQAWIPEDGSFYSGSFPKVIDDGKWIISSDDADTIKVSSLEAGETYYFSVYEYRGEGADRNYLTPGYTMSLKTLEVPSLTCHTSVIDFKNTKVSETKSMTLRLKAKYLPSEVGLISLATTQDVFQVSPQTIPIDSTCFEIPLTITFTPRDYQAYIDTLLITAAESSCRVLLKGQGASHSNHTYFISPQGSDSQGDGSIDAPWYNLQKAVDAAAPGDIIYCRGGEYFPDMMKDGSKTTVRITTSGTAEQPITITAYEDELPVMNFKSQQPQLNGQRGVLLTGNYWHINGIHFTRAGDNAIKLEGSHNVIRSCTFSYNFDTGLQLGFGHDFSDSGHGSSNDGSWCAYNDIIDCDSYRNCDYDTNYGSDADGFACKMHNGKGNRFIRCRAWENSDDAWDLYETDYAVVLIECWAWRSGKAEDHEWVRDVVSVSHGFSGNGNAIKMGGNGTGGSSKGKHEAWYCVAFNCDKSGSVKGFDQNSHSGGEKLVNCLAFGNGYDFMFERASANSEYYNNVCLGRQEIAGGKESHNAIGTPTDKGWKNNLVSGISAADYISLSEEDAKAPRGEDGSLPKRFARLKSGSKLVDAGIFQENPYQDEFPFLSRQYYGAAPDIGPYELEEGELLHRPQVIFDSQATDEAVLCYESSASQASLHFTSKQAGRAVVHLYDVQGRCLTKVFDMPTAAMAVYDIPFDVSALAPGTYLLTLRCADLHKVLPLILR